MKFSILLRVAVFILCTSTSCFAQKSIVVLNSDVRFEKDKSLDNMVRQVIGYYQNQGGKQACVPDSRQLLDHNIEVTIKNAKKVEITEVLQYNKYIVDLIFHIAGEEKSIFVSIFLDQGRCKSFLMEEHIAFD